MPLNPNPNPNPDPDPSPKHNPNPNQALLMTACAELHTRAAGLQAADPSLTPTLPLPLASPRPYPCA